MKKWAAALLLILLTGCANNNSIVTLVDPAPDQVIPSSSEGISLELLKQEFDDSPSYIETSVTNANDEAYEAGNFYHIEVLKDDSWYIITYSDAVFFKDPHFRDGGLKISGHSEIRQNFSIENLGVHLPAGQYRLVKTVLRQDPYHEITIAAPFAIY